jgi:hypothetical protein
MPTKGVQTACQQGSSARLALLDCLAGLEGGSAQLYQLPLGGVVGRLQRLGPIGRTPQRGSLAWIPQAKKIKKGTNPRREDQQNKGTKQQLTFNLLPLHLESLAPALDRLLQADDRGALLLEGPALILVRDAEAISSPSSFDTSSSRSFSDACALSRAA